MKHFIVALLFIIGIVSVLAGCSNTEPSAANDFLVRDITAAEARVLIQENGDNPDFHTIDVRTASEYAAGHIAGAVNLDVNQTSFRDAVGDMDTEATYLVYCRTGNRSRTALAVMQELGLRDIYHLEKGIVEWVSDGLPLAD